MTNLLCDKTCIKINKKCKCKNNIDLLVELRRRVNITYRSRIHATNRLRKKHKEYKQLNIYYSALITAISIVSIGMDSKIWGIPISNIVLMFSIVLTYFMFYTSEQNLQERAYRMEETFKALDKLKNKISIMIDNRDKIEEEESKKLYKEYESIVESIENHEQIDYDFYKLDDLRKKQGQENIARYIEVKKRVNIYKILSKIKLAIKYGLPTILMLLVMGIAMYNN
ncbi:SLATT domain-containing protein [Clostridium perfringens]|uniref:SLATT domain-containing protein n=2 Tax=Clostridium perfringens TaxID=1502 RepID=UPI000DF0F8C3|nr:SLATT domain-containing protein [Clostridium perfringens]EHK2328718.1 SLATT domain-containing protein [Clostridium perfringens]EHK2346502.1 SLATT domain-containing protein [Clostridium perfringens]ELC8396745.1 SLATT domain-containing protein [Clostridium perfringens]MBO3374884.1 SLATT domain-containing protein [Clostridium perfringens]MCX0351335.1 SLATT domain-containing protein [Clostridium perfringens]